MNRTMDRRGLGGRGGAGMRGRSRHKAREAGVGRYHRGLPRRLVDLLDEWSRGDRVKRSAVELRVTREELTLSGIAETVGASDASMVMRWTREWYAYVKACLDRDGITPEMLIEEMRAEGKWLDTEEAVTQAMIDDYERG